jgi:hypothetical protein
MRGKLQIKIFTKKIKIMNTSAKKIIKRFTLVLIALITCVSMQGFGQSLSTVISESMTFLKRGPTPGILYVVSFDFSLTDDVMTIGTISGHANLKMDSSNQKIGTSTIKRYFLKGNDDSWNNTGTSPSNKSFTVTTPFISSAATVLTITSSSGTTNYNLASTLPAVKTNNTLSGGTTIKEYIITGFIDPANPKKFVTLRIAQLTIPFG